MGKRHKARELAIQILFHMEFSPGSPSEVFPLICETFESPESVMGYAEKLVYGVNEKMEHIDNLLRKSSKNWRLERMSRVDRSILRLGVFEMMYMDEIPPKVAIDEAVELGKRYGTEDSGAFINGVLDNIYNKLDQDVGVSG